MDFLQAERPEDQRAEKDDLVRAVASTEASAVASAEAIRDQVSRILASSIFADSPRMARFLVFAVEETVNGRASVLKEIVIGAAVFDRAPNYDPRLDPIVRVEARRLRAKLCAYYETEGKKDPLIVEFPKGRYSPLFHPRAGEKSLTATEDHTGTIAVLPFLNLDPGRENDYFSDGLSEELIHALTGIDGLRVVAWHSAAQFRGSQEDLAAIRVRLDVAHVLRGGVRMAGSRLRVTAHLIETATGHYVWSETYDRHVRDAMSIQEEIAAAIGSALQLRFGRSARARIAAPRGTNPESYQLCLKGRYHALERTAEGLRRSIICFEQALLAESGSASAYAGLADAYTLLAEHGFAESCDVMVKAKAAAERSLELDPLSAEAHTSLGLILWVYDWQPKLAGEAFQRAIELNPGYAAAHHWYGVDYLAMLGRFDEASAELEAAIRLDPLSSVVLEGRTFLFTVQRQFDRAIDAARKLMEVDPSFYKAYSSMGRAYLQQGNYGKAIDLLEKARSIAGSALTILGALGQACALAGDVSRARQLLAELSAILDRRSVPCTAFALIHLGLGENDSALTWLERGMDRHQANVVAFQVHPAYDPLRGEPRFHRLLERIGFLP